MRSASLRHSSSAFTTAGMMTFLNSGTFSGTLPFIAASVFSPLTAAASRAALHSRLYTSVTHADTGASTCSSAFAAIKRKPFSGDTMCGW